MSADEIENLITTFKRAVASRPDRVTRMIDLAGLVASKRSPVRAVELCREILAANTGDREIEVRVRRLLSALIDGYHTRVINDERRSAAWDRALRNAIRPGMQVLEIGTGTGLLALMAARAGAGKVTTCERDAVMATIAKEIIALNGYAGRVDVVAKDSTELAIGKDLERPAELVFGDIFAVDMLGWEPLRVLADARRLLVPGASSIPAAGAICLALADWKDHQRYARHDRAGGFDISPFGAFMAPAITVAIGDPGLVLLSGSVDAFRFDFSAASQPRSDRTEAVVEATVDGSARGIAAWTRLQLDADTVLEARPAPGSAFYQSPLFYPLPQPISFHRGDRLRVGAAHDGKRLIVWPIGKA